MSETEGHLHSEEPDLFLGESFLLLLQVREDHTALDKRHHEVDAEFILKYEIHVYQEWVIHRLQNIFLAFEVLELLVFDDQILPDALHRVELTRTALDQIYFSERTLPNRLDNLKLFEIST